MAIDYRQGSVHSEDAANKVVMDRITHKDMRFMLFTTSTNAQWGSDRAIRAGGTPLREAQVTVNRYKFNIEVGGVVKVTSAKYNLTDVVFRVLNIKEDPLGSEKITLSLLEDFSYISQQMTSSVPPSYGKQIDYSIEALTEVFVIEAPYAILGLEKNAIIPLLGRKKGTETGAILYMSTDGGTSYSELAIVESYAVHGTLATDLDITVNTLDKVVGFEVDFTLDADALGIETISRAQMISGENLCLITDGTDQEILTFETITPDATVAGRYKLEGLYRGRYDTIKGDWSIGDDFWFVGTQPPVIADANIYYGATRYFKFVPYNNNFVGDVSDATAEAKTIESRSYKPYIPGNYKANDKSEADIGGPTYSTTIELTWSPRIRGNDAGINDPDTITDAAPTWEGFFETKAYISDVLVNTDTAINATSATYSQATIEGWNSGVLPDEIVFTLSNYITTDGIRYDSPLRSITIEKV